ncbi:MAG: ECF-type sigma factor [Pseudomonadota bacterium]
MPPEIDTSAFESSTPIDDQAVASIYHQLRVTARRAHRANPQLTINTTALVSEAWLKINQSGQQFDSELHYLKTAALAMRQILVDYARYRGAAKRDRAEEMPLIESCIPDMGYENLEDWLTLDQALNELSSLDTRAAEVVMLRFFAGLTIERTAQVMDISMRSAARDWRRARAFLVERLEA